jgi:Cys-tRNA(Pro)/Cys-tRNA(Cys) deacylase
VRFTEHPYAHDPAHASYGLEAAEALGLDPAQVFKTLLTSLPATGGRPGGLAVAVVPVTAMLDLKAMGAALGAKRVELAPAADAERVTGYVVGGISPFGQRRRLPTVVDESALVHSVVYVSGGRRGFDVGVAPADLLRVTGAITALVARAG